MSPGIHFNQVAESSLVDISNDAFRLNYSWFRLREVWAVLNLDEFYFYDHLWFFKAFDGQMHLWTSLWVNKNSCNASSTLFASNLNFFQVNKNRSQQLMPWSYLRSESGSLVYCHSKMDSRTLQNSCCTSRMNAIMIDLRPAHPAWSSFILSPTGFIYVWITIKFTLSQILIML